MHPRSPQVTLSTSMTLGADPGEPRQSYSNVPEQTGVDTGKLNERTLNLRSFNAVTFLRCYFWGMNNCYLFHKTLLRSEMFLESCCRLLTKCCYFAIWNLFALIKSTGHKMSTTSILTCVIQTLCTRIHTCENLVHRNWKKNTLVALLCVLSDCKRIRLKFFVFVFGGLLRYLPMLADLIGWSPLESVGVRWNTSRYRRNW